MKNKFLKLLLIGLSLTQHAMPAADKPASVHKVVVVNQDQQLLEAASTGKVELLKELLKTRTNVNTCNNLQQTPLHLACQGGNNQCVTILLEYKADVNKADLFGKTPLQYAIARPCYTNFGKIDVENFSQKDIVDGLDTVKILVEQGGAHLSIPSCPSIAPSRWAAINGHREIAEYLKEMENFLKEIPDVKEPDDCPSAPSSSSSSSLSDHKKRKREQNTDEQPAQKRNKNKKAEVTSDDEDDKGKEEETE